MRAAHTMPFGAEVTPDGVRFSIWAPASGQVHLELESSGPLAMERDDTGFHVVTVPGAAAGERYAYTIDGRRVPDPASRFNPDGADGPSEIVDPKAFEWQDERWKGRPWRDAVIYELHIGAFTPEGTFAAAAKKLPWLAEIGVTAIELMPVADGPGDRNWGYDGVLPYAPRRTYGRPEDLKAFVQAAHREGLMVFLDVVYNHFGPSGNYLGLYAPQFFTSRHKTPWGDAINFDGPEAAPVRAFFVHNALFWLEEYRFDGLRLDAVHAIIDDSDPDILTEIAASIAGRITDRHVHLVLENADNEARYLTRSNARPERYTAQWNDDFHHVMHVLLTGETTGYYVDYDAPGERLLRALVNGFVYQGEPSRYAGGEPRGESSAHLPPEAFVNFLQNHDQVGNRAFGERLSMLARPERLRAAETLLLLLPTPILLFMGEEFHSPSPFPFFCDFDGELADAVREGRRNEFAQFFDSIEDLAAIPDPNAAQTLDSARLHWRATERGEHAETAARYARLLGLRREVLTPRLPAGSARGHMLAERAVEVAWPLADGATLTLVANLADDPLDVLQWPQGQLLAASEPLSAQPPLRLPAWCAAWFLERPSARSQGHQARAAIDLPSQAEPKQ